MPLAEDQDMIQTVPEAVVQAAESACIRGIVARMTWDVHDPTAPGEFNDDTATALARAEECVQRCSGLSNGRVNAWFSLVRADHVSDQLVREIKRRADVLNVGIHAHLSTTRGQLETSLRQSRNDMEAPMLEETDRQIDNDRARVTRHRLAPGTHTGFHRHEFDYVVVPVTPGRMRILEGGEERFSDLLPGVAYFRPAGVEHDVFNGGDQELIFVEIELVR